MTDLPLPESEAEIFHSERRFACSRDTLWALWTEEKHLKNWWGPAGMRLTIKTFDFRVGGHMLYGMTNAFGTMWGQFAYRRINPPSNLAYVVSFTDEDGHFTRHPMAPLWPLEVLADQDFLQDGDGSILKSRSWPINATPEERAVFTAGHASMNAGFAGTFAALDAYLIKAVGTQ